MLERYKWNIWYCRRLEKWESEYVEGMEKFAPPVQRRLNVYPVSSELILESGGDLSTQYLKGKLPSGYPELYAEGDRCFIHKTPPKEHDPEDPGCDYAVESVKDGHKVTEILFRKLAGDP